MEGEGEGLKMEVKVEEPRVGKSKIEEVKFEEAKVGEPEVKDVKVEEPKVEEVKEDTTDTKPEHSTAAPAKRKKLEFMDIPLDMKRMIFSYVSRACPPISVADLLIPSLCFHGSAFSFLRIYV